MIKLDYYKILGIDKSATDADIKKAYRKAIKENHPDTKKTDKEKEEAKKKTAEINEAYAILSDKEKRQNYDQFGNPDGPMGNGFGGFSGGFGGEEFDIEDLLRRAGFGGFGNGRRNQYQRPTKTKGQNLRINLNINLSEFIKGKEIPITYKYHECCPECHGTGSKDGKPHICPTCHGTGMETIRQQQGYNTYIQQTTCRTCQGIGEYIEPGHRCSSCFGTKVHQKEDKIKVNIPKGNLADIVLYGKGNESLNGGPNGDLIIKLNVINDSEKVCGEKYIIQDDKGTLGKVLEIGFGQLILGDTIKLKNIRNKEFEINIPENSRHGDIFRVYGQGLTENSNLLVQIALKSYDEISDKEKELLIKLKEVEKKKGVK